MSQPPGNPPPGNQPRQQPPYRSPYGSPPNQPQPEQGPGQPSQPVTGRSLTSKPAIAIGAGILGVLLGGALFSGGDGSTTAEPVAGSTVTATSTATATATVEVTAPPRPAPTKTVKVTVTKKPRPAPTKTVTVTARPEQTRSTSPDLDPRFDTCTAAKAAGYGNYREGEDPEYEWYDDRDGDGVVCE